METHLAGQISLVPDEIDTIVLPRSIPAAITRSRCPAFLGPIPLFPGFKPLELSDQFAVESWARQFPPYSDFNFVSLWCWNTENNIELAWLNDNLVVKFKDYGSPRRFYPFLGTSDVVATTLTLCTTARAAGLDARLHLIPDTTVATAPELVDWVQVTGDRGQFDYVVSTEQWALMAGGKFRKKRNVVHHLERTHAPEFRPIDAGDTETQRAIETVFGRWTVQLGLAGHEVAVLQSLALRRFFCLDRPGDLLSYGVFIEGELCAYSINEALPGGYAMGHFWRADRTIHGLYPYLLQNTCRALRAAGCHYLNTMQDLGQPGLAKAKGLDRPNHFLRKFTLAPLDGVTILIERSAA